MHLSQKQESNFSICFCIFEIYPKILTFSKINQYYSWCISEITDFENCAKNKSLKSPLRQATC